MRRFVLAPVVVVTLAFSLACGGVWGQAMKEATVESVNEMRGKLTKVDASPEKDRVSTVLDDMEANAETFGVMEIASIQVEVNTAVDDGTISDAEASAIEQAYQDALSN